MLLVFVLLYQLNISIEEVNFHAFNTINQFYLHNIYNHQKIKHECSKEQFFILILMNVSLINCKLDLIIIFFEVLIFIIFFIM